MMTGCEQVGAYVVDALTDAEREEFLAHLGGCANCPREIREFSETTAALSHLVAVPPPAGLRAQVLAQVAQVRPLPPLAADPVPAVAPAAVTTLPRSMPSPINVTLARIPTDATRPRHAADGEVVDLAAHRSSRRGFLRLGVAAAAVGVVSVGAAGTITGWRAATNRQDALAAQKELLAAPDAELVAFTPSSGNDVKGSYLVSRQQNKGMFIAERMPKLPEGKTFQQWTITGKNAPTPDVTFDSVAEAVWLTGDLARAEVLAISIELAGGAQSPTEATILGTATL